MPPVLGSFPSLGAFAEHLAGSQVRILAAMEGELHEIGRVLSNQMQRHLGVYHPAIGPFPRWARLSRITLYGWGPFPGKIALGYAPPDNPLIATGFMHNSFSYDVRGLQMEAGSTDHKMIWHEHGTSRMPPRPVVGPVAYRNIARIQRLTGAAVVAGLTGGGATARMFQFAPSADMERITR